MSDTTQAAISILKQQFEQEIDKILECPVCFEIPTDHIALCNSGHHICIGCKGKLEVCGKCCMPWSPEGRNFLGENLRDKISEIKEALLQVDPAVESAKKCRIESCGIYKTPDAMVLHLMEKHVRRLVQWELEVENNLHHVSLKLHYRRGAQFDFAGIVGDLGIVFINVLIGNQGCLNVVLKSVYHPQESEYVVHLELPNMDRLELSKKVETYSNEEDLFNGAVTFASKFFRRMKEQQDFAVKVCVSRSVKVD